MSVEFDVIDGVARVTLNRPERMNAIDSSAEAALGEAWDAIDRNPAIRCAILTGTGRAFCAGADMKEDGPDGLAYWARTGDHGFGGIALGRRPSVPVIARVNGIALGGGFEMVLGCDLAIAAETASFGLPEPRVGRLPLDGMVTLPRRLPRTLAMGLLLTGRRIGAAEALELGLLNQVVPLDELDGAVDAWVRDILACAPLSLQGDQAFGRRHRAPDRPGSPERPSPEPGCGTAEPRCRGRRRRVQGEAGAGLVRPLTRGRVMPGALP